MRRGPVVGPAPVLEQLEEVKLRRPGLAVRLRPERGQEASPFWGAETGLDIRPRADRDPILRVDTAGLHAVLGGGRDVESIVDDSDVVCRNGFCRVVGLRSPPETNLPAPGVQAVASERVLEGEFPSVRVRRAAVRHLCGCCSRKCMNSPQYRNARACKREIRPSEERRFSCLFCFRFSCH